MTKQILLASLILFLAACGGGTDVPELPTPTPIIPQEDMKEKVDGPAVAIDTLSGDTLEKAEKKMEKEKPTPATMAKAEKPTLHGSWTLEKIYGAKEPFNILFPGKTPDITFNLKENTVSGNNGCNSYNGPFELKNGVLKISDLASTRMFCEGVKEHLFMTTLKMANAYKIDEDGKLVLTLDEENIMMFRPKK